MIIHADTAIKKANAIVRKHGTRNPFLLAKYLGIFIIEKPFEKQKGAYKVIERNRFIFLKSDLPPVMKKIVLLHEIGHDTLHRKESVKAGAFQEFNIFDMSNIRMEYEANIFAATISLPDDEILPYIYEGFDAGQIACAMESDINLVALKIADLKSKGHDFRNQDYNHKFLTR